MKRDLTSVLIFLNTQLFLNQVCDLIPLSSRFTIYSNNAHVRPHNNIQINYNYFIKHLWKAISHLNFQFDCEALVNSAGKSKISSQKHAQRNIWKYFGIPSNLTSSNFNSLNRRRIPISHLATNFMKRLETREKGWKLFKHKRNFQIHLDLRKCVRLM